ncbi:hypothetical protein GCM10010176_084740 [Nonomuraea spiralis]|nr:hypothetical protein GCM10010176_084740 [Nonomuraea spiralis]
MGMRDDGASRRRDISKWRGCCPSEPHGHHIPGVPPYQANDFRAVRTCGAARPPARALRHRHLAIPTDPAQAPAAWRLYFSNLPGPIDHVAVDQAGLGTVEDAVLLPLTATMEIAQRKSGPDLAAVPEAGHACARGCDGTLSRSGSAA